jgi:exopolysaccharide production protein ExoZ
VTPVMSAPTSDSIALDIDQSPTVESLHKTGGITLDSIQSLRAVAALIVVLFHSHIGYASSYLAASFDNEAYIFGFGKVGVHVFFVISGYIMYRTNFGSSRDFNAKHFILKRFLRVYPVYWAFVLMYVVSAFILMSPPKLSAAQYVGMGLLTPGAASLLIGPAWTLSYEIYFYIAFAAAMILGRTRGINALTAFFVTSVAIGVILHPHAAATAMATNALLLEFILGVWIARLTSAHAFPQSLGWAALAVAVTSYATGMAWGYDRLPSAIMWGLPSAALVAGVVILEQRGSASMTHLYRQISWLGDSSYSLYLCHILIIEYVLQTRPFQVSLLTLVLMTTFASVLFAVTFSRFVERPMVKTLQRYFIKTATPPTSPPAALSR